MNVVGITDNAFVTISLLEMGELFAQFARSLGFGVALNFSRMKNTIFSLLRYRWLRVGPGLLLARFEGHVRVEKTANHAQVEAEEVQHGEDVVAAENHT